MTAIEQDSHAAAAQHNPTKLKALAMLIGAMGMSIGFIVLCSALGNRDFYSGFLFLLCWTVMEHAELKRLPHTILGSAVGIALGYLLQYLIGRTVPMGGEIFGAVVILILYCQFMNWLPLIANLTTFTFVLVTTIPHIQEHDDFRNTAIALAIGIVYFTPLIAGAMHFAARSKALAAT